MSDARSTLIELERRFWDSMIDEETDVALAMLSEPSYMVSSHGPMKFTHAQYRQMAEHGSMVLKSYEFTNVDVHFPSDNVGIVVYGVKQVMSPRDKSAPITQEVTDTSTWVLSGGQWRCAMHTETPAEGKGRPAAG